MGALVEPPIAEFTTMALRNASRVMMDEGRTSWRTSSTIRFPVSYAMCCRCRYGAGIAAEPGSCIPSASANEFIVVAVPIVLQYPVEGVDDATNSRKPG